MENRVFENAGIYYLVEIYEDGKVNLKIKENGWSDIWSLPIKEIN